VGSKRTARRDGEHPAAGGSAPKGEGAGPRGRGRRRGGRNRLGVAGGRRGGGDAPAPWTSRGRPVGTVSTRQQGEAPQKRRGRASGTAAGTAAGAAAWGRPVVARPSGGARTPREATRPQDGTVGGQLRGAVPQMRGGGPPGARPAPRREQQPGGGCRPLARRGCRRAACGQGAR